jgi:serine/threonine protein kinase
VRSKKGSGFGEKKALFYSSCVLLALEHLHSKGILYRDIKPENIILNDYGYPILTDFGLSKKLNTPRDRTNSCVGTPEYMAPEVFLMQGHGIEADYWSFGALLFELITGFQPFTGKNPKAVFANTA